MTEYYCSDGTSVRINQLFDLEIEVFSIKITESLYGSIPTIEITFGTEDAEELFPINTELDGYLCYPSGLKDEFKGFIYSLSRNMNSVVIKLLCCDPTFTKDRVQTKYSTIDNAISSMWQRDRLDEVKTDVLDYEDPYYIYQRYDTNYSLCTKLCKSYKYNTIFGYTLTGLRIVDLSDPQYIEIELGDQSDIKLTQAPGWSDPKLYEFTDIKYVDYNSDSAEFETDPNHTSVIHYTNQVMVDSVYKELIGNYLYNTKLEISKQLSIFTLNNLKEIHLGDFVKIHSNQLFFNDTFLTKRIIDLQKTEVKVDYEFQSINPHE